eukprot:503709-Pelagomonas_calceolata.AAC.1
MPVQDENKQQHQTTNLRAQFQHLFSSAPTSNASRFRDFMNQADVLDWTGLVTGMLGCEVCGMLMPWQNM